MFSIAPRAAKALLIFCTLALGALPALADPETHLVGVYEGARPSKISMQRGHGVHIDLDRPGAEVTLFLGSFVPIDWTIETTPGTTLAKVVVNGRGAMKDTLNVNGQPRKPDLVLPDLRYAHTDAGAHFRALVAAALKMTGRERVASFHGSYTAPKEGFLIDKAVKDDPTLTANPLAGLTIDPATIPQPLRAAATQSETPATASVRPRTSGFEVLLPDGQILKAPYSLDVPALEGYAAGTYDPAGKTAYVASVGGGGFFYAVNMTSGKWRLLANLPGFIARSILFDRQGDRLILSGIRFPRSPQLRVFDLKTQSMSGADLPPRSMPGFTDLYNLGSGSVAPLRPVAADGNFLLMRATLARPRTPESAGPSRLYLLDMETGKIGLVSYSD